jgi:hypothetical protein
VLDEPRHLQLLLDALALLRLGLLLAHQLGHAKSRCSLSGKIVEQGAVVGRVILFAQSRAEIEDTDQLSLRNERHGQPDARFLHRSQRGRIHFQLVNVDGAGRGEKVSKQRVIRSDVEWSHGLLASILRNDGHCLGRRSAAASEE